MFYFGAKNNSGFTFIELILVIFFIGFLAAWVAPAYGRFQNFNNLELASMELAQALRRAQVLAQASSYDSNWGVYIDTGQITLFRGNSYLSRNAIFDEKYFIADIISISGLQEIVFNKFSGQPQNTGAINLTINDNINKTVTINGKGMLNYQ